MSTSGKGVKAGSGSAHSGSSQAPKQAKSTSKTSHPKGSGSKSAALSLLSDIVEQQLPEVVAYIVPTPEDVLAPLVKGRGFPAVVLVIPYATSKDGAITTTKE